MGLLSPEAITRYFQYYFYDRADEMCYSVKTPRDDNLLNLLADNSFAVDDYNKKKPKRPIPLTQSFATAGEQFRAIDAPTGGIVVPYGRGEELIAQLCAEEFDLSKTAIYLRQAQQYSVNIYPNVFEALQKQGAIYEIIPSSDRVSLGMWALREEYYSPEFGVSREPVVRFKTQHI